MQMVARSGIVSTHLTLRHLINLRTAYRRAAAQQRAAVRHYRQLRRAARCRRLLLRRAAQRLQHRLRASRQYFHAQSGNFYAYKTKVNQSRVRQQEKNYAAGVVSINASLTTPANGYGCLPARFGNQTVTAAK
jgi:hypothetical protein